MDGLGGELTLILLLSLFHVTSQRKSLSNSISNSLDQQISRARWKVERFSPCSVACGGGVRTRTIWCARKGSWYGKSFDRKVPASQCPSPAPPAAVTCHAHPCTARWAKGDWTMCSATCGVGTHTRRVTCESSLWSGTSVQVSRKDCGGVSPVTSRRCHVADCPYGNMHGNDASAQSITSEDYTLIQLRRTKRLVATVGGTLKVLQGQTVVIKCPVKNFSKKLVYWSKGYKLLPLIGRVRAKPGGLQIRRADPKVDSGIYTCIAGDQTAKVTLKFIRKDDPIVGTYKSIARKLGAHNKSNILEEYDTTKSRSSRNISPSDPQRDESDKTATDKRRTEPSKHRPLTYIPSKWSACSATCSSTGTRKRDVKCGHVTPKYIKFVADDKCVQAGLTRLVHREVCKHHGECARWKPGPWTKCRPSCGKVGHKARYLTCEWSRSGKPAYAACDLATKPVTRKPCKTRPCPKDCDDSYRHCSLARRLNMCRYSSFRRQCCHTCGEDNINETLMN